MPAYLDDADLYFALRACRHLEDIATRVATLARPSAADAGQLQECATGVRLLVDRVEARGKVH